MATSAKLALTFMRSSGENVSMNFNNAKTTATNAQVKALMEGIVANGNIFNKIPAVIKAAKFITTEETEIDLS